VLLILRELNQFLLAGSSIAFLIHKRYIPDPEQLNQQRFKCAAQMREPLYIVIVIHRDIVIFIPLFFEKLSPGSSSNFTTAPGSTSPNGADLILAGPDAFAITNSFVPFDFGITRSDILAANLSFELETDGLVAGDGIVASLNLNGTSIGSQAFKPIPEPSTVLAILTLGGAMATFKKKSQPSGIKNSQDTAA
jgi:hypothetical protein